MAGYPTTIATHSPQTFQETNLITNNIYFMCILKMVYWYINLRIIEKFRNQFTNKKQKNNKKLFKLVLLNPKKSIIRKLIYQHTIFI